jgi:hypothetical protein
VASAFDEYVLLPLATFLFNTLSTVLVDLAVVAAGFVVVAPPSLLPVVLVVVTVGDVDFVAGLPRVLPVVLVVVTVFFRGCCFLKPIVLPDDRDDDDRDDDDRDDDDFATASVKLTVVNVNIIKKVKYVIDLNIINPFLNRC